MSTVISADGTIVDYERFGAGPAVIFIGATQYRGIDPVTTRTAQELAEKGFTTIDYDRRSRGASGDTAPYALDRALRAGPRPTRWTAHVDAMRALLAEGKHEEIVRYNMTEVIGIPERLVDGMAQDPSRAGFVAVAPTIIYDVANSNDVNTDPDWKSRWAKVTVPTIVFSGEATFPGMPEAADATAAALPNATRRVITGEGHGPSTASILPLLLAFLRS